MRRVLAIPLVLALASCKRIDTSDAERKAKGFGEDRIGPVASVSCPSAKRERGVVFQCKVRFEGETAARVLEFKLTDDDGNFEYRFIPDAVGADLIAQKIVEELEEDQPELGTPVVSCGTGIVELTDGKLRCHVTAGETVADLEVQVEANGNYRWKPLP